MGLARWGRNFDQKMTKKMKKKWSEMMILANQPPILTSDSESLTPKHPDSDPGGILGILDGSQMGPWWSLMIRDDPWWSLMILDDPWWSMMILDDPWWSLMIPQDPPGSESGCFWFKDSESEVKMGDWLARIITLGHFFFIFYVICWHVFNDF